MLKVDNKMNFYGEFSVLKVCVCDEDISVFRSFFFRKQGPIVDTLSVCPSVCLSVPEIENDSRYLRDNIADILYCNILISSYQYHKSSNYVLLDELLIDDS